MKTIIMKTFAAGVLLTMLFTGCAKKGDTGPAGTNGTNGNANVISTNNVTLASSNWSLTSGIYTATLTTTGISQAVVDKGVVMVYQQYGPQWVALPTTLGVNITEFDFQLGQVEILNLNSDGTTPANPGAVTYRIVIIPASMKKPNVNPNSYADVKAAYNLKD